MRKRPNLLSLSSFPLSFSFALDQPKARSPSNGILHQGPEMDHQPGHGERAREREKKHRSMEGGSSDQRPLFLDPDSLSFLFLSPQKKKRSPAPAPSPESPPSSSRRSTSTLPESPSAPNVSFGTKAASPTRTRLVFTLTPSPASPSPRPWPSRFCNALLVTCAGSGTGRTRCSRGSRRRGGVRGEEERGRF